MVLLLPQSARANLTDFVWVIIINLALSLVVVYLFIPSLMEYLPVNTSGITASKKRFGQIASFNARYRRYIHWGVSHKWVLIILFVVGFGIPTCLLPVPPSKNSNLPQSTGIKHVLENMASWKP